eukprot:3204761-Pyramimonas_sp.AAC.1
MEKRDVKSASPVSVSSEGAQRGPIRGPEGVQRGPEGVQAEAGLIGLHVNVQQGIDYRLGAPATCIVASGKYQDDCDNGDTIEYTGMGGMGRAGVQVRDQELQKGNVALQQNLASAPL